MKNLCFAFLVGFIVCSSVAILADAVRVSLLFCFFAVMCLSLAHSAATLVKKDEQTQAEWERRHGLD